MKTRIVFTFTIIMLISFSCKKEEDSSEIQLRWQEFLSVLEQKNLTEFKEYASDTIRCYMCIENTEHEQKVLEYLRDNDSTWYDKLYNEKIYIPINKFLDEDYDLIFNNEFVEVLKNSKTVYAQREIDGLDVYEVLVTTTKPSLGFEGGQHDFQFTKEEGIFKLSEISTIP